MRIQVGTLRGGPSASCPVFVSVALASSGWLSRGRSRGRSTQLTITPQVRRQIAGTRKAARLSRRATRPREIEQSERTCRPTAARPPYGRIDLLWRRGTRARGAACVCGVAGVLQPAALGCSAGSCRPSGSCPSGTGGLRRCGMGVYAFAAARRGGLCARAPLAPRARLGRLSGWLIAPPGLCLARLFCSLGLSMRL